MAPRPDSIPISKADVEKILDRVRIISKEIGKEKPQRSKIYNQAMAISAVIKKTKRRYENLIQNNINE